MKGISYREPVEASEKYKEDYLHGLERVIRQREGYADRVRQQKCKDILENQEAYRQSLKAFLGWPLTENDSRSTPQARTEKLSEDKNCTVYRVSIAVLEGYSITGLLFQKDEQKRPLVIAQHGGEGTPEQVGNLYGETFNYNQMIERMLSYDVNVFAPQLLLWNTQTFGIPYQRDVLDARLKSTGSSIAALEIYAITRILDYFQAQSYVSNFGMLGLSYGGFYTLYTAAIDERIRSAVACSFSHTSKQARCDWTWAHYRESFSDAEAACLVYPRKLCVQMGDNDPLFDLTEVEGSFSRVKELSGAADKNWFTFLGFSGGHEFCWDNEPLWRLANDIQ